jgi:hypothetical protein
MTEKGIWRFFTSSSTLITKIYHLVPAASIAITLPTPGPASATVVYIHLNPLRAGIVQDIEALKRHPFSGHAALMGCVERLRHDTPYVLSIPGSEVARRLGQDRSAVSRAVRRIEKDPELLAAAASILPLLQQKKNQH